MCWPVCPAPPPAPTGSSAATSSAGHCSPWPRVRGDHLLYELFSLYQTLPGLLLDHFHLLLGVLQLSLHLILLLHQRSRTLQHPILLNPLPCLIELVVEGPQLLLSLGQEQLDIPVPVFLPALPPPPPYMPACSLPASANPDRPSAHPSSSRPGQLSAQCPLPSVFSLSSILVCSQAFMLTLARGTDGLFSVVCD